MNKKEIQAEEKFSYICRVIKSCKTVEQLNNAKRWGLNVLSPYYKTVCLPLSNLCKEQEGKIASKFVRVERRSAGIFTAVTGKILTPLIKACKYELYRLFLCLNVCKILILCYGKGRSKELIEKRDEKLLRRYHYWTEIQRLRYDDTLRILSEEEFFISEERIMAIIRENYKKIPDIVVKPVPKVKKPKLSAGQLALLFD